MERKSFKNQVCPVAQAVEIFGDWWVPLILREAMYGVETFSEFQSRLKISKNILNQRLTSLVENKIMKKELYQKPNRYRYILTPRGRDALQFLVAFTVWSNSWLYEEKDRPIDICDGESGAILDPVLVDRNTGQALAHSTIFIKPGPGFPDSKEAKRWRFGERGEIKARL
jgi:DNA-binding HxlR family transcriptional regulator